MPFSAHCDGLWYRTAFLCSYSLPGKFPRGCPVSPKSGLSSFTLLQAQTIYIMKNFSLDDSIADFFPRYLNEDSYRTGLKGDST
jgi:hypothetical protein